MQFTNTEPIVLRQGEKLYQTKSMNASTFFKKNILFKKLKYKFKKQQQKPRKWTEH